MILRDSLKAKQSQNARQKIIEIQIFFFFLHLFNITRNGEQLIYNSGGKNLNYSTLYHLPNEDKIYLYWLVTYISPTV